MKRAILSAFFVFAFALAGMAWAEHRFPPPDFESGYALPGTETPAARGTTAQYLDVVVLALALGLGSYLLLKRRSRKAILGLGIFSLLYFGFYRKGCICAIGAVQNVALGIFDSSYAVPIVALAFFTLPLLVALFAGRTFCSSVCPHGALQELILIKPVKVPVWLEHSLGIVPFIYLGAAVAFAATGSAFIICRYDPFVPVFRLTGSFWIWMFAGAFLVLGLFVGRPYCRFLCPLGALLRIGSIFSKWRVTITPDSCTQCRLCEDACPYGVIQQPVNAPSGIQNLIADRKRLAWMLALLPLLVLGGAWAGSKLSVPASRVHPTVELAERYLTEQQETVPQGVQTAAALSMSRAEQDPKALLTSAVEIRQRFVWAGWLFGAWVGLVIAVKLISLALRQRRTDYEPDRGGCVGCARCFSSCPNELLRQGLIPATAARQEGQPGREPALALAASAMPAVNPQPRPND
jgi:NosR/NirI family transcriptional regulator, nitrous oxide reductase regulator